MRSVESLSAPSGTVAQENDMNDPEKLLVRNANAWERIVPRLIASGVQGKVHPGLKGILGALRRDGLDVGPLRSRRPTLPVPGAAARPASWWPSRLVTAPPHWARTRASLTSQLAGGPRWVLLGRLAEAYVTERLRPPAFRPARPPAPPRPAKRPPRNRARSLEEACRGLAEQKPPAPAPAFGRNDDQFTIFLDEAWPQQDRGVGVLAGLVWVGDQPDPGALPLIGTHLLRAGTDAAERGRAADALRRLRECRRCLPFVMPLTVEAGAASRHYERLVNACLQILLGWLLPGDGRPAAVRVYLEHYGRYQDGFESTEFHRGLLEGAGQLNPGRFRRWTLERVQWQAKTFGYIPYGDLLAYLALEHTDRAALLTEAADLKNWPGYVPLSLDLVPRLTRLDGLEQAGNVTDVLDLVSDLGEAPLARAALDDLGRRMGPRPDLRLRLLEALDERYRAKDRDLDRLRPQLEAARRLAPAPAEGGGFRSRLLHAALDFQNANHDGDPIRAREAAAAYAGFRAEAAVHDRELAAFVDLNLAVHHADRFDFSQAQMVVEDLLADPLFPALAPRTRGWVQSSLGQYHAMQDRPAEAEACFVEALRLYDAADLPAESRERERDQTGVYRAINALDGGLDSDMALAEAVLGPLAVAAGRLAGDIGAGRLYHHHLLLRCLWARPALATARDAYRARLAEWRMGERHPWPLIALYRALLLWERGGEGDASAVETWFVRAIAAALRPPHGPTLRLIAAMIAVVARCCDESFDVDGVARDLLDGAAKELPAAAGAIAALRDVLDHPAADRIDEALAALPFNYH